MTPGSNGGAKLQGIDPLESDSGMMSPSNQLSPNPAKTMAARDMNPLKSDSVLQDLLKQLNKIKKYEKFQQWKDIFLNRLESFLFQEGTQPAGQACDNLHDLLKEVIKMTDKVSCFNEKGDLGDNKKTISCQGVLGIEQNVQWPDQGHWQNQSLDSLG